jgi:S-adenosylhomocysteine hydrolase
MDTRPAANPVAPVTPLAGDRFVRDLPASPRVLLAECGNRTVLEPERYLCLTDVPEYRLHRYGTTPEVDAAIDELAVALPRLPDRPEATPSLSPLARVLLDALVAANQRAPMPFIEAREPTRLRHPDSGLVEAALKRLAERAAEHGSITARSLAERYGPAGVELFAAWRRVVPVRRGLQWLLRRAHLPIVPRDLDLPPTRAEIDACLVDQPAALDRMVELSSIPATMPLITAAAGLVEDGVFAGLGAVCVQHLLGTQVALFSTLVAKGLRPERTEIVGVPYSTNFVTEQALRRLGFTVSTPRLGPDGDVEAAVGGAVRAALARALGRCRSASEAILVVDDGGKATRAIHAELADEAHRFRVVEQTTRGITEVAALSRCRVPVVDVARSLLKRHESTKIGEEVSAAAARWLARLSMPGVHGRPVLVVGFGMIGRGVAARLSARGASVTVYEVAADKREEARHGGLRVEEDWGRALEEKHLVVGCTGQRIIGRDDLPRLSHETVLASASSRNVEIDMRLGTEPGVSQQVIATAGPGDDRYWTWLWRTRDRDLVVLHNGFPLNFDGAVETGTPESIQQTRAIMLLGAAQAAQSHEPGLLPLDPGRQQALARLAAELLGPSTG